MRNKSKCQEPANTAAQCVATSGLDASSSRKNTSRFLKAEQYGSQMI